MIGRFQSQVDCGTDVVWLQEISRQEQLQTLRRLLPQYELRWANIAERKYPGTGLAMLYRRATVTILGEPEYPPQVIGRDSAGNEVRWNRLPFAQTIRIGNLKCRVGPHVTPVGTPPSTDTFPFTSTCDTPVEY